jgi:hypothetical protein
MKPLVLLSLLLAGLAGCQKAAPAPDPFLGHWRSDAQRSVAYDANGQIARDTIDAVRQDLDVTAATMTFTGYRANGTPGAPSTIGYTRIGENLVFDRFNSVQVNHHVRALTATGFTLESDYHSTLNANSPRTASSYTPFHR